MQPEVRNSQKKIKQTFTNNILSYINLQEFTKLNKIKNIIYVLLNSVYGDKSKFRENNLNPKKFYLSVCGIKANN